MLIPRDSVLPYTSSNSVLHITSWPCSALNVLYFTRQVISSFQKGSYKLYMVIYVYGFLPLYKIHYKKRAESLLPPSLYAPFAPAKYEQATTVVSVQPPLKPKKGKG